MVTHEINIRVRYAETDQMGFVYYGNYATYLEVARVEMLRKVGCSYKELETKGIKMPVLDLQMKFIAPAKYDDLLTVKTTIKELPLVKIKFEYKIYNKDSKLLNEASTTLVFIDAQKNKPTKIPFDLLILLNPYFNK